MGREELEAVLAQLDGINDRMSQVATDMVELRASLLGRLNAPPKKSAGLITIKEAAKRLGVKPQWLYRRHAELPFIMKISNRAFRVSERGLALWMEKR